MPGERALSGAIDLQKIKALLKTKLYIPSARPDPLTALRTRLVSRPLALHQKLAAATVPTDKELYQRQIEATDRQIDALVYELYGLTEEEIEIVESLSSRGTSEVRGSLPRGKVLFSSFTIRSR